jgi:hypothetical protein
MDTKDEGDPLSFSLLLAVAGRRFHRASDMGVIDGPDDPGQQLGGATFVGIIEVDFPQVTAPLQTLRYEVLFHRMVCFMKSPIGSSMYMDERVPGICQPSCETMLAHGFHINWVDRQTNLETNMLTIAIMEMRAWLPNRTNASPCDDLCQLIKGTFQCRTDLLPAQHSLPCKVRPCLWRQIDDLHVGRSPA